METLVLVAEHKDQYHTRNKGNGFAGARFGSPPMKEFQGINCRSYDSGAGLLPTPIKTKCRTTPITKRAISVNSRSEEPKNLKRWSKSSAITIPIKMKLDDGSTKEEALSGGFHFSELWAGPAYSNSPPPSSLPIPKFFVKPKRTVSLELPISASVIDPYPISKSAPVSPTRGCSLSPRDFFDDADYATKTLRRILNLDVTDE